MSTIYLSGLDGSEQDHWQTLWRMDDPDEIPFQPTSWRRPELEDWVHALDHAVAVARRPPLFVAHSLGCLLVARWCAQTTTAFAGAFLVAPPDPEGRAFPHDRAPSFTSPPRCAMRAPALVVASSNDPYGSLSHAQACAADWGAGLVDAGPIGHINVQSALGRWPSGAALLTAFRAGLDATGPGLAEPADGEGPAASGPVSSPPPSR